ncbi:hypothetical protein [Schaalia suimastitidis]|uniref:hypothetical protein n=1 Tax=Schaalia suimastitidis TaxID=121163 RepID=UPI0004071B8A|nr:hypothetical protein [Schaalia suimastitidis]
MVEVVWSGGLLPPAVFASLRETLEGRRLSRQYTRAARRNTTPVVVIDGPSGAGKSTFLAYLARQLRIAGVRFQVARADDWFPGWDGHASGGQSAAALVAGSRSRPASHAEAMVPNMAIVDSSRVGYRHWDWEQMRADGVTLLDPSVPLIIEGCGVLTLVTRQMVEAAVWIDALGGEEERQRRAIVRDGEIFEPWWHRWAAHDRRHRDEDLPQMLADIQIWT